MNKTTENRNPLLRYFVYYLQKQRTTFPSQNLITTYRHSTRKNNTAARSQINNVVYGLCRYLNDRRLKPFWPTVLLCKIFVRSTDRLQ